MRKGVLISALVCTAALIWMVCVLVMPQRDNLNFIPPAFEEYAQKGEPEVSEDCSWSKVDATVFNASLCGQIESGTKEPEVWLQNPADSEVWLKLRVEDEEGNVLGETGILKSNEYVKKINLSRALQDGEAVRLRLMSYEPEIYYSAGSVVLNTTAEER